MSFTSSSKSLNAFSFPYVLISAFKTAFRRFLIDIVTLLSITRNVKLYYGEK